MFSFLEVVGGIVVMLVIPPVKSVFLDGLAGAAVDMARKQFQ